MPETTSNVEFAHTIHERSHHKHEPSDKREEWVEILEAVLLAIVAVVTAWSGYQAARWDSQSAHYYSLQSRSGVLAQGKATLAGQDRLYDVVTFDSWLSATLAGKPKVAEFYQRRFRPEYRVAFDAWMKLNPLTNPSAPPGAIFMPEYRSALASESEALSQQAEQDLEKGVATRETADDFVRITVLLATVLLMTVLSQRFKRLGPRYAIIGVATVLLVYSVYLIAILPQA